MPKIQFSPFLTHHYKLNRGFTISFVFEDLVKMKRSKFKFTLAEIIINIVILLLIIILIFIL